MFAVSTVGRLTGKLEGCMGALGLRSTGVHSRVGSGSLRDLRLSK
jgi:hypothetical protein